MTPASPPQMTPTTTAPAHVEHLERGTATAAGATIHWWAYGSGGPPLLLVHGGGAHSGWWHPMLRTLGTGRRVIGMDLSGHGDSDRRPHYDSLLWSAEIAAVIDAAAGGNAVVLAHSMGTRAASVATARYPERVAALLLLDGVVPTNPNEIFPRPGTLRPYPSMEAAMERFRIAPGETLITPDDLRVLAEQSVRSDGDGFVWKFDPHIFTKPDGERVNTYIPNIQRPVVLIRGGASEVTTPELGPAFELLVGRSVPQLTISGAYHHVMLDQPEALADLLNWFPESRAAR